MRKEADSWKRIQDEALKKFIDGSYLGEYQERLNLEFEENLAQMWLPVRSETDRFCQLAPWHKVRKLLTHLSLFSIVFVTI